MASAIVMIARSAAHQWNALTPEERLRHDAVFCGISPTIPKPTTPIWQVVEDGSGRVLTLMSLKED